MTRDNPKFHITYVSFNVSEHYGKDDWQGMWPRSELDDVTIVMEKD